MPKARLRLLQNPGKPARLPHACFLSVFAACGNRQVHPAELPPDTKGTSQACSCDFPYFGTPFWAHSLHGTAGHKGIHPGRRCIRREWNGFCARHSLFLRKNLFPAVFTPGDPLDFSESRRGRQLAGHLLLRPRICKYLFRRPGSILKREAARAAAFSGIFQPSLKVTGKN